ncbi:MAG: hypothetical protein ACOYB8_01085 [Eubacteriaceae bacterium]
MKKSELLTSALVLFLCIALFTGCGSSSTSTNNNQPASTNTKSSNQDAVEIVASGAYVSDLNGGYSTSPDPVGNVYCEYKNNSSQTIQLTSLDADFMDASGTVLSSSYTIYAPKTLAPGETGYAGAMRYNGSGITMDVQPTVKFKPVYKTVASVDNPLKVEDVQVVSEGSYGGDVNNQIVQVTVSNSSSEEISTFTIVVGLYDSEGNLIGVAKQSMGSNPIPANGKAIEDCDDLVLQSDDLSTVASLDARVDNTSAY